MPVPSTPLQMIAGASLGNNQGLALSTELTSAANALVSTTLLTPYFAAIANASVANVTGTTLANLITLASNSCPALADNTPVAYANSIGNIIGAITAQSTSPYVTFTGSISGTTLNITALDGSGRLIYPGLELSGAAVAANTVITDYDSGSGGTGTYVISPSQNAVSSTISARQPSYLLGNSTGGFTNIVETVGNAYLGNGNAAVFCQLFPSAQSFCSGTNSTINSAENSNSYLGSTFTSMNSLITGNLSDVNLAMPAFGQDLENLGLAIDLNNLGNLGSPVALLQQIVSLAGLLPSLSFALVLSGIDVNTVASLASPDYSVTDTVNKKIYKAFELINTEDTAEPLNQILRILRVTTSNIQSLADLLNPVKMFPNSFATLTVRTPNGLRSVYLNTAGTVNSDLITQLPKYVISTVT
jgi:hypothetical protein